MPIRWTLMTPILLAAATASAQFNFAPAVPYGQISNPSGMSHADFNGDGHLDLVTTSDNVDRVVLFQNSGSGTFVNTINVNMPASSSPQDVIAGDFDGDLDFDLAVALRDPAGSVRIMLNNGTGIFSLGGSFAVGDRPRGLSLADFDGDLDLDLAVANLDSGNMSILANNGLGSFLVTTIGVGADPRDTTFGNFMNDADLEIAVTNHDDRTITILDQVSGVFAPTITLNVGAGLRPDGIIVGDFNGDGLDDLAAAASDPSFASIFINNGAGFNDRINYPTGGTNSSDIRVGDFNCDGYLDLVLSNSGSGNISLLANNGNGTFGAAQLLATGAEPSELTVGDWDGDRDLDIAVVNRASNNISVLINETCTIVSGDFNGDGIYDCVDVDALVADIAAGNNSLQFDLTGDGAVNGADLTQWLAEAGAVNLASGNPYLPGDANLNGNVDAEDFLAWNASKFTTTAAWCSGDFNADGLVDGTDFLSWNENKFTSADGAAAVPEPMSLAFLTLACGALAFLRHRVVDSRVGSELKR